MSTASVRVTSKGPQPAQRLGGPGLIALVAFLVPALVFAAVIAAVAAWESGRAGERAAMERARDIITHVDSGLKNDLRAISAVARRISGVAILQSRPNPQNAALNADLFPDWIGSLVWRIGDSEPLFSSLPSEELPVLPPSWAARIGDETGPVVDGVERLGGVPMVLVHVRVPGDPRNLVLTTALRTERFLDTLMDELLPGAVEEGAVGGIVDREGEFIARSIDHARRVGTPATVYVRDAVKVGGEGVYRGRTFEGLANVTAYYTSPLTGWSAHIAISDRLAASSAPLALMVGGGGGLLSLALAGGLVWLILQDARRRHEAERALAQAQRIESMGRLTGGIAHDFNNLLTVIIGNLERARIAESPNAIEDALASARRAATLTRSLLLYSRQQPLQVQTVDVNTCVSEAADVIRRSLGPAYEVAVSLDDEAGAVRVDSAQLSSALLNLAVNARDAMGDSGVVTLRTARRTLAEKDGGLGLAAGDYVEVSVVDNGPGMAPDVARRAFEPFFTTKDVGKGTGLGLAQVDGFARQSGGIASIESAPGAGATVTLTFPRAGDAPPASPAASAPDRQKPLRVLLVEDEPGVRDHASQLMTSLGHRVTACADASAAEKALREKEFDLLFSDIVLPGGTSGVALADLAQDLQPGIAVLLATGYAGDELDGREEAHWLLLKPYGFAELAAAVTASVSVAKPAAPKPAAPQPSALQPPKPAPKVLLVEDEPLIRMMAADTLTDAGCEVVEAASAAAAREAFAADADSFSLAIIDIGLPDGSGADLAHALRERRGDLRIVIASGQSAASLPPGAELLAKPYGPEDLTRAVHKG